MKSYIIQAKFPECPKAFFAGNFISNKTDIDDMYEDIKAQALQFLPNGFEIYSIRLGTIYTSDGKIIWDPSMRNND